MSDFDAVVVGAGCAGCAAAYELARAGRSVLLVERGNYPGSKNMTGGRVYAHALERLFPDFRMDAPLERKVSHERITLMTADAGFTADLTVLCDGANSRLVQRAFGASAPAPEHMAVGVKQVFELPARTITDRIMAASDDEGAAWLFAGNCTKGAFGGGFAYTNAASRCRSAWWRALAPLPKRACRRRCARCSRT